jgi:predicted metalloprotease
VVLLLATIVVLVAVILGSAVLYLGTRDTTTDTGIGGEVSPTITPGNSTASTSGTTTSTTSTTSAPGATPTGTAALQGNPLFANPNAGLITQACNADGWPSNSTAGKRFFDSITPCLDRAWSAALTGAGISYRAPTVLVPTGTRLSSPCGVTDLSQENVAAFYCPTNETLYMPPQGLQVNRYGNQPVIYLAVFAHEYGHHVQLVTGILDASSRFERQYGRSSTRGLEMSRRTELQAQCFGGMFTRSVSDTGGQFTRADYRTAYEDQERGDPPGESRTHGTNAHAQGWWNTGYQTNRLARCNTWSASSTDVA